MELLIKDLYDKKNPDQFWKFQISEDQVERQVIDTLYDIDDWPTFREHLVAYINRVYLEVYENSQTQLLAWIVRFSFHFKFNNNTIL